MQTRYCHQVARTRSRVPFPALWLNEVTCSDGDCRENRSPLPVGNSNNEPVDSCLPKAIDRARGRWPDRPVSTALDDEAYRRDALTK
jgi:hypothetical protein